MTENYDNLNIITILGESTVELKHWLNKWKLNTIDYWQIENEKNT